MSCDAPREPNSPRTHHASAERLPAEALMCQTADLSDLHGLRELIDCMPDWVMILNAQRQFILGNKALRDFAHGRGCGRLPGLRPGEVLDCRHARQAPSGCGTGLACRTCGMVNSILAALAGNFAQEDCRIGTATVEAFDLRVWASPFHWAEAEHVLVVAMDISHEKRRQVLERVFFHDILNTAASLQGLSELIRDDPENLDELKSDLFAAAESLVNEIRSQRILLQARENALALEWQEADSRRVLGTVAHDYRNQAMAAGRHIVIGGDAPGFLFKTDLTLLHRVLGNLLKNALEASRPGDEIALGAERRAEADVFWCHNPGVIPESVQSQMFQRSFSTKGAGRGVGTYSIRLLTERYLSGTVGFVSTEGEGTRVWASFPRRPS